MKNIHIRKDTPEQMKKTISLQGEIYTFTSMRDMRRALAQISRDSTLFMLELNELYISVHAEYRRAWFQMRTYRGINFRSETVISTQLNAVADRFQHLSTFEQSPYMLWVDLRKICLFLHTAADELRTFHRKRGNTMPGHGVAIIKKRLAALNAEITAYRLNPVQ